MKKTPLKKRGKSDRSKLESKLDKICSEIIRIIEPACVQCGSVEKLTAGHVFSRRKLALRWDVSPVGNIHTQCWPCNFRHGIDQWPYWNWYINKFGKEQFDILREQYEAIRPIKTYEMEQSLEVLKEWLKALKDERK